MLKTDTLAKGNDIRKGDCLKLCGIKSKRVALQTWSNREKKYNIEYTTAVIAKINNIKNWG